MSATGAVLIDLRDVAEEKAHRRVAGLGTTPAGARVVVVVGPLTVNPHVARLLREHVDRLDLEVWGEAYAVRRWLDAVRTGDMLPLQGAI